MPSKAKFFTSISILALALSAGVPAFAGDAKIVKSAKDQTTLSISGQFAREMHYVDDGHSTRVRHQDSDYSSSRFRFHVDSKINAAWTVSGLAEIAIDDARNTSSNSGGGNGGRSGDDVRTRIADIAISNDRFGTITMGAGDAAGSGVMTTNAHGVFNADPNSICLSTSDTEFRNSATNALSGTTICDVLPDLDFSGRTTRVRYDTPVVGGFMLSGSMHDDSSYDLALRFSGRVFDTQVEAAVGFSEAGAGAANNEVLGGMLSLVHSSGFGVTGGCALSNQDNNSSVAGAQDPFRCGIQSHYQRKFSELGLTSIVGEFEHMDSAAADGDTAKAYGISVQQAIDSAAMEVWGKYSKIELDRDGADFDDVNIVSVGTRVKF